MKRITRKQHLTPVEAEKINRERAQIAQEFPPAQLAPVRHWTSRNDANHSNRHAECLGVKFCAMPYQPYLGRLGDHLAIVTSILLKGDEVSAGYRVYRTWSVQICGCLANGQTKHKLYRRFGGKPDGTSATDEDRDNAFRWAAEQLTSTR